jgi:biopolymer transport protein ExbB
MLTEKLMRLTITFGSEWVMVLLLALSVISIAVVIERAIFFGRRRRRLDLLDRDLTPLINSEDIPGIKKVLGKDEECILCAALSNFEGLRRDRQTAEKIVASTLGRERLKLERRLTFLGTLGNNAPFVGLFGTVLGVIRAFHDLSLGTTGGQTNTSAVMAGLSEALVATAVGLFVALPAVVFYNYFMRQVDHTISTTEALAQGILASLPATVPSTPKGG